MRRTKVFTLVMAIVWTVIGVAAVVVVSASGVGGGMQLIMLILAFVAIAGNWLRWFRSR